MATAHAWRPTPRLISISKFILLVTGPSFLGQRSTELGTYGVTTLSNLAFELEYIADIVLLCTDFLMIGTELTRIEGQTIK